MKFPHIVQELNRNAAVFESLLRELPEGLYQWRPEPGKWCLLEIISHLCDEEREDFRARLSSVLSDPSQKLSPIDPEGWVSSRSYMENDFPEKVEEFLAERQESLHWLKSLEKPAWDNTYQHPQLGEMSARLFLVNWLAHDYLHIRQILRLKMAFLQEITSERLNYAGNW